MLKLKFQIPVHSQMEIWERAVKYTQCPAAVLNFSEHVERNNMRAVVQRVREASVTVDGSVTGEIGVGLLVLLGVDENDTEADAKYVADKVAGMRIFPDAGGKVNLGLEDIGGAVLVVSQFTLHGDCRKGRRPSFTRAARPEKAIPLYELVVAELRTRGLTVGTGVFGAMMDVRLLNDGPFTLLLDSERMF